MENKLTTVKLTTGEFDVYFNGEKTEFSIINGSKGLSGHDSLNVYGIVNGTTGTTRWIGTIQACKKNLTFTLGKRG